MKNPKKVFGFLDSWISIVYRKVSVLYEEQLSSAVIVLTNSLKISYFRMRDLFQHNISQDHDTIGKKCHRADFSSGRDT